MTSDKTLKAIFAIFISIIALVLLGACFLAIQSIGRINEVDHALQDLDERNVGFTPRFRAQIYQLQATSLRATITGDHYHTKRFEILDKELRTFLDSRKGIFDQEEEKELLQTLLSKMDFYLAEMHPGEQEKNVAGRTEPLTQIQERLASMSESLQPLGDELSSMELRWRLQRCHVRLLMVKVKATPTHADLLAETISDLKKNLIEIQPSFAPEERKLNALENFTAKLTLFEKEAETITGKWIQIGSSERRFERLEKLQAMRDEVIEIAQTLGDSRRTAFTSSLSDYKALVKGLQYSILIALGMLFLSLFVMGSLAKKTFLSPIKVSLAKAEEIATTKENLANVGTLAAGLAHEIRNPITAIKARLFALGELARSEGSMSRQIEAIQGETNRMEGIVQDFLSFARPSESNLERTSVAVFFDEIHSLAQPDVTSRGASLIMGRTVEGRAYIDQEQLKQVFLNLVRNAAEASPPNGGEVYLSSSREGNTLLLAVSDNGGGIPQEHQGRIFEPFFSKKKGGTGLGLSICKNIVEAHHGTLTFKSSDFGTTFTISLEAL